MTVMTSFLAEVAEQTTRFNDAMGKEFPGFIAQAMMRNILGPCVVVDFANVASEQDAQHGIIQNASIHMRFVLSLTEGHNAPCSKFEIETPGLGKGLRDQGVKFRKISGKTPEEALQKLASWFFKNSDVIKSVERK